MGKAKTDRTKRLLIRAMNYNAHRLADQQIRQAIVKEEQRQDVNFDRLIKQGMIMRNTLTCVLAKKRLHV